ncbi:hypothetical protein EDC18_1123 [Natranaerovirga pectinivora]|uniref:PH (Pleckstrin Homology) domain-containing protein n=1 Tax=Natranaerovirga pectinivora TaxID=682400 RepID=A0A4R3MKB0_9FIRM|nr:hypothetical protein [Natranaerovirga pectinivora]TCT12232.1 hypothetical protein EDC18_1123 [Natranaerovirga pectinivora]
MYKEISKRQNMTILKFLIYLINIILITNVTNFIGRYLDIGSITIDIIIISLISIIIYIIFKKYILAYKYMVIGEEFIIQELIGRKEKIIINLNKHQIEKIESVQSKNYNIDKKKKYKKKRILYNTNDTANNFYCIFKEDDELVFFEFQPSKKLLDMILH